MDIVVNLKLHKLLPHGEIESRQFEFDPVTGNLLRTIPIIGGDYFISSDNGAAGNSGGIATAGGGEEALNFKCLYRRNEEESAIRVIKLGDVEDLNPMTHCTNVSTVFTDPTLAQQDLQLLTDINPHDKQVMASMTPADVNQGGGYDGGALTVGTNAKRESKIPNIPTMIICQNCDTNFPTKYQYQRHQCEFNAEKVILKPNTDAKDVVKEGTRMKFTCVTCGKQFVSKNNLDRHQSSHDASNVNVCEFCQKQFVSENRLRIHKENHCKKAGDISKFYRSDVAVWQCSKCRQVFASATAAFAHIEDCTASELENSRNNDAGGDSNTIKALDNEMDEADAMIATATHHATHFIDTCVRKISTEMLLHCEFCNCIYADKQSLSAHQRNHTTAVNYECVTCREKFDSYVNAAKHWLTKCTNEANLFFLPKLSYCDVCDRTFKSHEVLYSHKIKKKHYRSKKHNADQYESAHKDMENDDPDKEKIVRLIEDVLMSMHDDKKNKEQNEDSGNSDSSIKAETRNDSDCVLAISDDDDPDDPINEDEVAARKQRRGRKRKAGGGKRRHNKADEAGRSESAAPEPGCLYQCERCTRVFTDVSSLEKHRDNDHPANYKCEECDQVVHSSKALLIHSRAHQSLKPYVCEICKRCYSQTSHLWQHMRFHQGIKPFACPHEGCEARYTIRPDLKDHIRKVHTRERPFKCSVCDKCFLTGSVYYQHRLIHTNDRRYGCDICSKRFFRADALNNHRRIHTDERPYPCEVCGRLFRQKGDRNKHVRTQHPTEVVQEIKTYAVI